MEKSSRPTLLIAGSIQKELLDGLSTLDLNVVLLDKNMERYEQLLWDADFMLITEGNAEKYLNDAWQNGVIPIVGSKVAAADNYDPIKETGNSFTFERESVFDIFAAMVRALETYKFPHDWKHLVAQAQKGLKSFSD